MTVNERLGRTGRHQDVGVRETMRGEAGHVLFGPYAPATHGVYEAEFRLARDAEAVEGDPVCAVIDIALDGGQTILAQRKVYASDLEAGLQSFSLLFVLRRTAIMECRLASTGAMGLKVGLEPTLVRVAGVLDEPPRDGLASTPQEMIALAADTRRLLRPLAPYALAQHGKVRMGAVNDGGYVCIDDFDGVDTALSFGINDDISWDLDAAARGLKLYQFDHTVADPAPDDPRMVFEAKRIGSESRSDTESLSALIRRHDRGRARPNLILKMDIEGAEWDVIEATSEEDLARLAWITCEMHYFQGLAEAGHRRRVDHCLQKLMRTFVPVHIHANVWGGLSSIANIIFPNVLEATFANRTFYAVTESSEALPGPLDQPCFADQPDLFLGAFRF